MSIKREQNIEELKKTTRMAILITKKAELYVATLYFGNDNVESCGGESVVSALHGLCEKLQDIEEKAEMLKIA